MEFDHIDRSTGEEPPDLGSHYQGTARIQRLAAPAGSTLEGVAIHFEPGGRTRPHIHHTAQILTITAGRGVIGGTAGRRLVEPGDVVAVEKGDWHWHGATPMEPMSQVTVQAGGPENIDWEVEERDWGGDCPA